MNLDWLHNPAPVKGYPQQQPTCGDCRAFVQVVRLDGKDVERCPWASRPRDCGSSYKRDMTGSQAWGGPR